MPSYGKPFAGLCLATAVFLCGLTGYPVAPEFLPAAGGTLDLSSGGSGSTLIEGSTITITGDGFMAGGAVTISIYSEPQLLAEVVAGQSGAIHAAVQIPSDLTSGQHTLAAFGNAPDGSPVSLQAQVTVSSAAALPFTGTSILATAIAGLVLLVLGFVFVRSAVFGRRLFPE